MTLNELMNSITTLGGQIRAAANTLAQASTNPLISTEELEKQQGALSDMQKRMAALQAAYYTQRAADAGSLANLAPAPAEPARTRDLADMLKSNEYARAFAYAMQHGLSRKTALNHEQCRILYDALTESGGSPAGTDGGFLVPEDIDHSIQELRRSLDPLAALFNEETVTAPTGWRVIDTAPTKGLVAVDEMGEIDDDDDQPAFAKVSYSCAKKALILPVSNELMADNVANLFAYLSRWFAKKLVITENLLLIAALQTLTGTDITADPIGGVKTALNVGLDPAISAAASIITNQSGFNAMDLILDDNDRPMLQPDPTNATVKRFGGRPVHAVSNAVLADVTTGSGAEAVTKADLFIGDGKAFATLFRCGGYELASTDVGGNAWRTDSTELRGIVRLGVTKFDAGAMVRRTLTL